MNYSAFPLAALAFAVGSAAAADGIGYLSYGASYQYLEADGESGDLSGAGGSFDYRMNDVVVNGSVSFVNLSDGFDDLSVTSLGVRAGYFVLPQFVVYGGINYVDTSETSSFSTYNLGTEYGIGAVTLGLNYTNADEVGFIEQTSLYASYRVSSAVEVAAGFTDVDGATISQIGVDYDDGQFDVDALYLDLDGVSLFGVAGSYDFGSSLRAVGSYTNIDGEADLLSIGGGYQVSQDMWLDVTVGRIDLDGDNANLFGLALTYELGNETLLIDRAETSQARALGVFGTLVGATGF